MPSSSSDGMKTSQYSWSINGNANAGGAWNQAKKRRMAENTTLWRLFCRVSRNKAVDKKSCHPYQCGCKTATTDNMKQVLEEKGWIERAVSLAVLSILAPFQFHIVSPLGPLTGIDQESRRGKRMLCKQCSCYRNNKSFHFALTGHLLLFPPLTTIVARPLTFIVLQQPHLKNQQCQHERFGAA